MQLDCIKVGAEAAGAEAAGAIGVMQSTSITPGTQLSPAKLAR